MNILITSAGRRVSLVREFMTEIKALTGEGKVFTADMNPMLSSACQVSDGAFRVPHASSDGFGRELLRICSENDIRLIIPTIDTELLPLSGIRDSLAGAGTEIVLSEQELIRKCRDKRLTQEFFRRAGLKHLKEIEIHNAMFPVFAKPFDGSSSIGARVIRNSDDLSRAISSDSRLIFFEYLDPAIHTEFTVDLYFSRQGILKCAVPRERLEVRAGEVSKGVTRRGPVYDLVCDKFRNCEGFCGCVTLQLFRNNDNGEFTAIEINPRFGGGYPLSYRANANYPAMIIREYLLGEDPDFFDDWKTDLLMLRYDDEIIVDDYKG
ncbi:MAG: ATP-grasp domain-containing protein [Bacteroidales bacterium]|jgi:carbamoyl-phosphate synthase large subunit|nr:ATP-grasp domain-containing protein [Bacteroidales bacterium]